MVIIRQAGRDWSVVNWPSRNAATLINPMDGSIPRIRLPKNKKKMGPGKRGERDSNCCWRQVRVPFESARGCWLLAAGCCSSQARVLHSCCAMHACASTSPMLSSSLLAVLLESVCALFFPFFIFLFGPRLVRFQQTATEKVTRVSSPVCWDSDAPTAPGLMSGAVADGSQLGRWLCQILGYGIYGSVAYNVSLLAPLPVCSSALSCPRRQHAAFWCDRAAPIPTEAQTSKTSKPPNASFAQHSTDGPSKHLALGDIISRPFPPSRNLRRDTRQRDWRGPDRCSAQTLAVSTVQARNPSCTARIVCIFACCLFLCLPV